MFGENFQLWRLSGESCPEGTIPIRRTREEDVFRASSVQRFGRKLPKTVRRDTNTNGHEVCTFLSQVKTEESKTNPDFVFFFFLFPFIFSSLLFPFFFATKPSKVTVQHRPYTQELTNLASGFFYYFLNGTFHLFPICSHFCMLAEILLPQTPMQSNL